MGTYLGKAETTICSWKADERGNLRQMITCEQAIQPVRGIHSDNSFYFGVAGDSGAAVLDEFGRFVGLYFAGNDYTGSSYFTAAKDLFSDIRRMTSAEYVREGGSSVKYILFKGKYKACYLHKFPAIH